MEKKTKTSFSQQVQALDKLNTAHTHTDKNQKNN